MARLYLLIVVNITYACYMQLNIISVLDSSVNMILSYIRLHTYDFILQSIMLAFFIFNFFYCCTVHFDICRVHSPTSAFLLIITLKFTLKYT